MGAIARNPFLVDAGGCMGEYDKWEEIYQQYRAESLPWELGEPRPVLVDLIRSEKVTPRARLWTYVVV